MPGKLPPRQWKREKIMRWGKDHPGIVRILPPVDRENWKLRVDGMVENPVIITWNEFLALPLEESVSDFHCVETWSVPDQRWFGLPFRKLVEQVQPKAGARYVWIECVDGYTTSLALDELLPEGNILAIKLGGNLLDQGLGGPLRLIVPEKYAYKSAMYITHIEFTEEKELGYWEKRGYSDSADIWTDDRFSRRK